MIYVTTCARNRNSKEKLRLDSAKRTGWAEAIQELELLHLDNSNETAFGAVNPAMHLVRRNERLDTGPAGKLTVDDSFPNLHEATQYRAAISVDSNGNIQKETGEFYWKPELARLANEEIHWPNYMGEAKEKIRQTIVSNWKTLIKEIDSPNQGNQLTYWTLGGPGLGDVRALLEEKIDLRQVISFESHPQTARTARIIAQQIQKRNPNTQILVQEGLIHQSLLGQERLIKKGNGPNYIFLDTTNKMGRDFQICLHNTVLTIVHERLAKHDQIPLWLDITLVRGHGDRNQSWQRLENLHGPEVFELCNQHQNQSENIKKLHSIVRLTNNYLACEGRIAIPQTNWFYNNEGGESLIYLSLRILATDAQRRQQLHEAETKLIPNYLEMQTPH